MTTILVTAGPTREYLDEVRFLSNASSGRMGFAVAAAARDAGCEVTLITGPTELTPPGGVAVTRVVSALEMRDAAVAAWPRADIAIGVAAVADYRPAERFPGKPPREAERIVLELIENPDVIATLAADKGRRVVVGFALQSTTEDHVAQVARAHDKLVRKNLDLVVLNSGEAMESGDSTVTLLTATTEDALPPQPKAMTAAAVVERTLRIFRARQGDHDQETP